MKQKGTYSCLSMRVCVTETDDMSSTLCVCVYLCVCLTLLSTLLSSILLKVEFEVQRNERNVFEMFDLID